MKCLNKDCDSEATCRGLCPKCYKTACRKVRAGKWNWKQLEVAGMSAPANLTTRFAPSAFTQAGNAICVPQQSVTIEKPKFSKEQLKDENGFIKAWMVCFPGGASPATGKQPTRDEVIELFGHPDTWHYLKARWFNDLYRI
jgi:hypothetical protein